MAESLNRGTVMRKHEHQMWIMVVAGLLAWVLAGCAPHVGKNIKVSEEQRAKYDALSVTDAIYALEQRVTEAKKTNMPFFAPNYFIEAAEILSAARKASAEKPKNQLIGDVAKGEALLDKGDAMMAVVQNHFAQEIELKALLDESNAGEIYPREYEKLIGELSSLIEKVELEKADKIDQNQAELIKAMQALDIQTVQYTALHASDLINAETKNKSGEKLVPVTFAVALEAYKYAENHIAQAPHNKASVQRAGEEALFAARHARHISQQVLSLQNQFKVSVEAIVLQQEKHLLEISNALGHPDLRDQPIDQQAAALVTAAGQLARGKETQAKAETKPMAAHEQIYALEKKLKEAAHALEQANGRLAAQEAQIQLLSVTHVKAPVESKTAGIEPANATEEKSPDMPR